jgi:hypothetical protein
LALLSALIQTFIFKPIASAWLIIQTANDPSEIYKTKNESQGITSAKKREGEGKM